MLAVSARRHGLLLAVWLEATVYVFFFCRVGVCVANGMQVVVAELRGPPADVSEEDAAAVALRLGADTPLLAATLSPSTATPMHGAIFLADTVPPTLPLRSAEHGRTADPLSH